MENSTIPLQIKTSDLMYCGHSVCNVRGKACFFTDQGCQSWLSHFIIIRTIVESLGFEVETIRDWDSELTSIATTLPFEMLKEIQELGGGLKSFIELSDIVRENGKEFTFEELPEHAKKSLIQNMAINGEAWADYIDDSVLSDVIDWPKAIEQVEPHVVENFWLYDMPTDELTGFLMDTPSGFAEDFDSWEAYHQDYIETNDLPEYSLDDRWPCIAWCEDEGISDGWHRLHSYVKAGHSTIPLIV